MRCTTPIVDSVFTQKNTSQSSSSPSATPSSESPAASQRMPPPTGAAAGSTYAIAWVAISSLLDDVAEEDRSHEERGEREAAEQPHQPFDLDDRSPGEEAPGRSRPVDNHGHQQ